MRTINFEHCLYIAGVTGHILDDTWCLKSFALGVRRVGERHYAQACSEHFMAVATEWGIHNKVTTFATDNARNMVNAVALTPYDHMPCIAHSLQLSVNKALAESGIDAVLSKCRKIVGHFKHSAANNNELNHEQLKLKHKEEGLVQDVPTRWNSTLQMIERLVANKDPVLAVLQHPDHKHQLAILTDGEWEKLRVVQSLLEPCRYATEMLGGEQYVSCSVVLPMLCYLFREMTVSDDDAAYAVRFKNAYSTDLTNRRQNCNLKWLEISTALDPRFKLLKCLPKGKREEVWAELKNLILAAEREINTIDQATSFTGSPLI